MPNFYKYNRKNILKRVSNSSIDSSLICLSGSVLEAEEQDFCWLKLPILPLCVKNLLCPEKENTELLQYSELNFIKKVSLESTLANFKDLMTKLESRNFAEFQKSKLFLKHF